MIGQDAEGVEVERANAALWKDLAGRSPLELHTRIVQAIGLLTSRFPGNPDALLVVRTLQGWTLEELASGRLAVSE